MVEAGGFGVRHIQCFLQFLTYATFSMQITAPELTLFMISTDPDGTRKRRKDEMYDTVIAKRRSIGVICFEKTMKMILSICGGIWSVNNKVKYLIFGLGLYGAISAYSITIFIKAYGQEVLLIHQLVLSMLRSMMEPLLYSLMPKWVPNNEQGKLAQLIFPGLIAGVLLEYTIGYYLGIPEDEWPQMLYWAGNCSVLWGIAWAAFAADHPKVCFFIERKERQYIQENQPYTAKHGVIKKIPWSKIFFTVQLYPVIFTHICVLWAEETAFQNINSFLIFPLDEDLSSVTKCLSYSHLAALIICFPLGVLTDLLVTKGVPRSRIRNIMTCIGMWGGAAALAFMGQSPTKLLAKVMAGIYFACSAPLFVGFYLSYLHLSPNFAGLLYGIGSCLANFITLWVPIIREELVQQENRIGWNQFMYTAALANYLGALIFTMYSSAKVATLNTLSHN